MIRPIDVVREVYFDGQQKKLRQVAIDRQSGQQVGECFANYIPDTQHSYSTKYFLPSYAVKKGQFSAQAKPHMNITSIEVAEQARRQGVAKRLVSGVVKESEASGFGGRVVLHAENFRESPLPAYIKMGFTTANPSLDMRVKKFLEFPMGKFDASISSFMMLTGKAIKNFLKMV